MLTRIALLTLVSLGSLWSAPEGGKLYEQHCALCHGVQGMGVPGVFPPLAGADFLAKNREKSLRAPLEGLMGKITVNGVDYYGAMPPVLLKDEELAAVFEYVFTTWGNAMKPPTVEEITQARAKTKYPTLAALQASMVSQHLPAAPAGWEISVAAELSFSPVRLVWHEAGKQVLALAQQGDVWSWKSGEPHPSRIVEAKEYVDPALGSPLIMGITVDREGRLYITSNQRNEKVRPISNETTIFRSEPWSKESGWKNLKSWLHTPYPFGIGPYNHGLSHIAQGPDGLLYVTSGARTDGGEPGKSEDYDKGGETPLTAVLWRVDPAQSEPKVEVFARGLRNTFGFCWDDQGRLVGTENGPDAEPAEELNHIVEGRHYGFPFQFSDWDKAPYPYTPTAPKGLSFSKPLRNVGPGALGDAKELFTFEPHSCPSGVIWLGKDWPAPFASSFLTARYGNLLKLNRDVGFDVLQVRTDWDKGTAEVTQLLAQLGRPIDLIALPGHQILIAEYCRGTTLEAGIGTPGRLLLLKPKQ